MTKAIAIEAKKGHSFLAISVFPDGQIIIQDYSEKDDGKKLIRRLQEKGIKTEITYEGMCG